MEDPACVINAGGLFYVAVSGDTLETIETRFRVPIGRLTLVSVPRDVRCRRHKSVYPGDLFILSGPATFGRRASAFGRASLS